MSVCQYLASEVHSPLAIATTDEEEEEEEDDQPASKVPALRKKSPPEKKAAPPPKPKSTELPPPSSTVSQIMEMGFPRRHIEYAMQVSCLQDCLREE